MRKNAKKLLAMTMATSMALSSVGLQAFAAENPSTETVQDGGLTTEITTTTATDSNATMVKVTVTVEKNTTGTDADGNDIVRTETSKDVTTTDNGYSSNVKSGTSNETITSEDETVTTNTWSEDGTETKTWTDPDSGNGEQEKVTVSIEAGKTTGNNYVIEDVDTQEDEKVEDGKTEEFTSTTVTIITDRTVTVTAGEVQTTVHENKSDLEGLQSELKFDRNSEADQKEQKKVHDLYTDNGHFSDPSSITVTGAPEGYPFQYVGTGDYGGHYVSHIRVIYEKDEDGNAVKDADGNYVIKELQHANGTPLTKNGVPTTDINGPFDQTTGTRPLQFLLMNENGDAVYAYCIDVETGTVSEEWYKVANLEDNDYYASEDAERHVRNIVTNGYWGTAEGTGSMEKIRADLKAAVAAGTVEKEYDITFVLRGEKHTEGYVLKEGEYVGNGYICRQVTEHVVLTDEVIDAFTSGEALDATQSAIWSYANGSRATMDGKDGMIVGDLTYASSALGDSRNGQNDYAGAARTLAFYNYLMSLDEDLKSTTIINEKNNIDDMSLSVGNKVADHANNQDEDQDNDVYEVEMSFTLAFVPNPEKDELLVYLTDDQGNAYTDANGNPIIKRLAGKNTGENSYETITPDENGVYTLLGLQLGENKDLTFDLRLEGLQYLEQGVYIYTAARGTNGSQTMVGVAEGTNTVDVSKAITIRFDVDENNHVVAERTWHEEGFEVTRTEHEPDDPNPQDPPQNPNNEPEYTRDYVARVLGATDEKTPAAEPAFGVLGAYDELEIEDDMVPLGVLPATGDRNPLWMLLSLISGFGIAFTSFIERKKKHNQ